MPVILDPYNYELWLDPGMNDADTVSELLKPYDARLMRCYPVSTRINHVANEDEECSRPVVLAEIRAHLGAVACQSASAHPSQTWNSGWPHQHNFGMHNSCCIDAPGYRVENATIKLRKEESHV
jgi:hypothetical protein